MMNICTLIDFEKENVSYSKFSASGAGDPGAITVIAYKGGNKEDKPDLAASTFSLLNTNQGD